jgi:hypothetical protein
LLGKESLLVLNGSFDVEVEVDSAKDLLDDDVLDQQVEYHSQQLLHKSRLHNLPMVYLVGN